MMESRQLDKKPLGYVLDFVGYLLFVIGLLCAMIVAYSFGRLPRHSRKRSTSQAQHHP